MLNTFHVVKTPNIIVHQYDVSLEPSLRIIDSPLTFSS